MGDTDIDSMPSTCCGVRSGHARLRAACLIALGCAVGAPTWGADGASALADLSLEQLSEIRVTTVSRFEERLDRAAASAYVISAEDIRRSGATTIAEALRLAPTLNVARADANQYAISARGFNNVLANKMLVLIDGRTVYTPLFSGVFWEAQDLMLEDVDRIEVISGPSTALWGSNAVNGLIHIITRSSGASQGIVAAADAGNRQRGAAVRYGASLGDGGHFRAYAKSYDRSDTHRADGSSVNDAADGVQVGFRADWARAKEALTLQGDAYRGAIDQIPSARHFSGANVRARWDRTFDGGSDASVQAYAERTRREHPQTFGETLDTVDIVGQYGWRPAASHRVLVGAGYRHSRDDVTQFAAVGFMPPSRSLSWGRVFAQDQIELSRRVAATLATSVETNPYTGAEVLPSVRLAWQLDDSRMAWGSLSRAVRAPSRVDREFVQPAQPPFVIAGGPNFQAEVSNVVELGYRAQPSPSLSYSVTLFHHRHSRLRSLVPTPAGLQFENGYEGWTRGLEAWTRWRVHERWRVDGGVSLLQERLHLRAGAADLGGTQALGNDPRQWWSLRSTADLTPRLAWQLSVRHVGALPAPSVPSYTAVDTRLAWSLSPSCELALSVQNVFDPKHAEWGAPANRVELERSFLVQLRWGL